MKRLCVLILFILVSFVYAGEITGTVKKVIDGDTIVIIDDHKKEIPSYDNKGVVYIKQGKYKVRLSDIDAPELKQDYGKQSKEYLEKLIKGKTVLVEFHQIDMYGRIVGIVYTDVYLGIKTVRSVNETMVKEGYAWWYKQYSVEHKYGKLEEEARSNKRGMWKGGLNLVPPWQYRKSNKK